MLTGKSQYYDAVRKESFKKLNTTVTISKDKGKSIASSDHDEQDELTHKNRDLKLKPCLSVVASSQEEYD